MDFKDAFSILQGIYLMNMAILANKYGMKELKIDMEDYIITHADTLKFFYGTDNKDEIVLTNHKHALELLQKVKW